MRSSIGDGSGQLKGVEFSAHAATQGCINGLMLAHAGHPCKGGRRHLGSIMVPVSGEIRDVDHGIGECSADQVFNIGSSHGHGLFRFHQLSAGFNFMVGQRLAHFFVARVDAGGRQIPQKLADDIFIAGLFKISLNDGF
jgi:hypothetical protein